MRDTAGQAPGGGERGVGEGVGADAGHGVRVLVVDDDEGIRETLRFALEDAGYAVQEAPDGAGALAALRASPHGLVVLLDHVMPDIDGATVLRTLAGDLALARRHVYLVLTAAAHIELLTEELAALPVPPDAVVRKPFDVYALLAEVQSAAARLHGR